MSLGSSSSAVHSSSAAVQSSTYSDVCYCFRSNQNGIIMSNNTLPEEREICRDLFKRATVNEIPAWPMQCNVVKQATRDSTSYIATCYGRVATTCMTSYPSVTLTRPNTQSEVQPSAQIASSNTQSSS